jgi:GrpB-like predicted nucleotidyltransferase (UPF0157 family)
MTDGFPEGYDPRKDGIELSRYDSLWPEKFNLEKRALRHALGFIPGLKIEHIGSTSIPEMAAKPVLDIMVGVARAEDWPRMVKPIQMAGYYYWASKTTAQEMLFVKGISPFGERRTHHVHVYELQGDRWNRELAFRDYLISHPREARNYEALKRNLAMRFPFDREAYTRSKSGFIEGILSKISAG